MIAIFRMEFARYLRQKKFLFWSLIGVVFGLPTMVIVLGLILSSLAGVKPPITAPLVAVAGGDSKLFELLDKQQLTLQDVVNRDEIEHLINQRRVTVGVYVSNLSPSEPLQAELVFAKGSRNLKTTQRVREALYKRSDMHVKAQAESMDFDSSAFRVLTQQPRIVQHEVSTSQNIKGYVEAFWLVWTLTILYPLLVVMWTGSTRIVEDRARGSLSSIGTAAIDLFHWIVARWLALLAITLVMFLWALILTPIVCGAYITASEYLLNAGLLEGLSDQRAVEVTRYLVDVPVVLKSIDAQGMLVWGFVCFSIAIALSGLVFFTGFLSRTIGQAKLGDSITLVMVLLVPFGLVEASAHSIVHDASVAVSVLTLVLLSILATFISLGFTRLAGSTRKW